MRATPKTLSEAIENAFQQTRETEMLDAPVPIISAHVRDFLAQKFTVAMHQFCKDDASQEALKAFFMEVMKP
jgi:hypothetical protein